jgi:hypothetical protein
LGQAWIETFGLRLLKLKTALDTFEIFALIMGLKIC